LLLVAAGCGSGDDDTEAGPPDGFEATPEYLEEAVADLGTTPHRFEMSMHMGAEAKGRKVGFGSTLTGEFDGQRQHVELESSGLDLGGGDSEAVVDRDDEVLYVRAPDIDKALDKLGDLGRHDPFAEALADLDGDWARVDLRDLAEVLPDDYLDHAMQVQVQGLDPASFVHLVADAESVERLGSKEFDGDELTGLAATVTAADLTRAQQLSQGVTPSTTTPDQAPKPGSIADKMATFEYQVEVWFDHDGNVRRLAMDMNKAVNDMMDDVPSKSGKVPPVFTSLLTLELSDYGGDISIDVPDDAHDLTDEYGESYEASHP